MHALSKVAVTTWPPEGKSTVGTSLGSKLDKVCEWAGSPTRKRQGKANYLQKWSPRTQPVSSSPRPWKSHSPQELMSLPCTSCCFARTWLLRTTVTSHLHERRQSFPKLTSRMWETLQTLQGPLLDMAQFPNALSSIKRGILSNTTTSASWHFRRTWFKAK